MAFCRQCGAQLPEDANFCAKCGEQVGATTFRNIKENNDSALQMIIPIGRSGWAIAAGYLGLLSFVPICAPLAIVTGLMAIQVIKKNPEKRGVVRAWVGIVLGTVATIGWAVVFCKR